MSFLSRPGKKSGQTLVTQGRVIRTKIVRYYIQRSTIAETAKFLRNKGRSKTEGYALFAGIISDSGDAFISSVIIPKDHSSEYGFAELSLEEITKIAIWLRENRLFLLAQIHSHPGSAFHSPIDDAGAISTRIGFLSIVVPYFGRNFTESFKECKVFEYAGFENWREWEDSETSHKIIILNDRLVV